MREKTQIEKMIDAIEETEIIKKESKGIIKESKNEDWNKSLEESPYNHYYGVDMKCALYLIKAIKKGLSTKDAMYISKHHYKIPVETTRNLIYKYSDEGEKFYMECAGLERVEYNKRRAALSMKLTK